MTSTLTTRRGQRLAWPDATRALGVLAVVLFHVLIWNHAEVTQGSSPLAGLWDKADAALSRLRMPILFALSGLLASRALLAGGFSGVKRRIVSSYYLYVVWLVIYGAVFLAVQRPSFPHAIDNVQDMAQQLLVPDTTLWFIFALAVYPLVVLVFRTCRFHAWMAFTVALGVWLMPLFVFMPGFTPKVVQCFIFFVCGVYLAKWVRQFAEYGWPVVVVLCAVFAVVTVVGLRFDGFAGELATLLGGLAAIPASIALIAKLCQWNPAARAGAFIGQRTLSIYALHPLILCASSLALNNGSNILRSLTGTVVGDALYPLALTVVIVAAALGMDVLLRKVPGNVLLQLPGMKPTGRRRS